MNGSGALSRSLSNSAVVVLGGGHGLAAVLTALRNEGADLTVIVSIAEKEERDAEPQQRFGGRTSEDLRRSLEALTDEEGALLRAIRRPLAIERLGRQPLGNLVLGSVARAFGDYATASKWLGEQLGIAGSVLPATTQPLRLTFESAGAGAAPTSSGGSGRELPRVRFASPHVDTPESAVKAIEEAQWVLLAPGPLYDSVLATAAVPDLNAALTRTRAHVLWIANLAPDTRQMAGMSGIDHLRACSLHALRVDVVLHDPTAELEFDASGLERYGATLVERSLRRNSESLLHDPGRLRAALRELITSESAAAVAP